MNVLVNSNTHISEKKFGLFFSALFALMSLYGYYESLNFFIKAGTISLAFVFLAATFWAPKLLIPLNKLWFELGILLGKVTSPLVLGVLFFGLITPIALIMRLLNRDELKLKKSFAKSYWVDRLPPGPAPDSFKRQF